MSPYESYFPGSPGGKNPKINKNDIQAGYDAARKGGRLSIIDSTQAPNQPHTQCPFVDTNNLEPSPWNNLA